MALDESVRPAFQALQHRSSHPHHQIVFYAFDVLHVDGRDVMDEVIEKCHALLPEVVGKNRVIRVSDDLPGSASQVLEGVIAKRRGSVYQPGERSNDWRKLKLENQQEFVIGGFRPDGGSSIDALVVGYFEGKQLKFARKVRAGFTSHIGGGQRQTVRTPRAPGGRHGPHSRNAELEGGTIPSVSLRRSEDEYVRAQR